MPDRHGAGDDGEIGHDVQTECGICDSNSFHIFETNSGEIVAIECADCGEVFDL